MPGNPLVIKSPETTIALPDVSSHSEGLLEQLTDALGVPRDILPDNEQIMHAWKQLPRQLDRIPPKLRDQRIVRMCVAVASGLFDAAVNYIWNATILELREKVRLFGIRVVPQILDDKDFDEEALLDMKDSELLDLCQKLNLISTEDFHYLDQCRDTRNNFSAAHPSEGSIDEDEFLSFLSRCIKHALISKNNPKGVDTKALLAAIKGDRFKADQLDEWDRRIEKTFDAQRELIFTMLHGIFCDPASSEEGRQNSLAICDRFSEDLSPKTESALVDRHQDYKARGDAARAKASLQFFEKLGLLSLLDQAEIHAIITTASKKLLSVHNSWDNFHNEPPFAERLARLSAKSAIPETARAQFVEAIVTCGTGNPYGVSRTAMPSYRQMVKSFSPAEVKLMLDIPSGNTAAAGRIRNSPKCKAQFRELIALVDSKTVPTQSKTLFTKWTTG
jgi:hypothetical protein